MNRLIARWEELRPAVEDALEQAQALSLSEVTLKAPNPCPVHVFGAPANYQEHVAEMANRRGGGNSMRERGFFLKASASIVRPFGKVLLPHGSKREFHHEAELAVIIGKSCKNVPMDEALDQVFGYCCVMDLTMRLTKDSSEERATRKSFSTFTPLGPWIVTKDEIPDPQSLQVSLTVNSDLRQHAKTATMAVPVAEQVSIISSVVTLNPGDVIATGTPGGVGSIKIGDRIEIDISGIGGFSMVVEEDPDIAPMQF